GGCAGLCSAGWFAGRGGALTQGGASVSESNRRAGEPDPTGAVRAALAEALGSEELEIVAEATDRLPDGTEVRLVTAAVSGRPNPGAALAVDPARTVPQRRGPAAGPR